VRSTTDRDRVGPPAGVRAVGALMLGLVTALLASIAFAKLYWATRHDSLFEVWPLGALTNVLVVLTVAWFSYRHVGRGGRRLTRLGLVVMVTLATLVLALGAWVMLRPDPLADELDTTGSVPAGPARDGVDVSTVVPAGTLGSGSAAPPAVTKSPASP
jgi:hypothetical protein